MISTGLCRTSTPRNCKQDYESPLHLNFSKIPAPLDWREAPTRRCVVGFLATKPGTLGIFVGGDPIFLPSDFSPLSSAPSLSITGRDHCVVAKIYLPGPVVGDLIRTTASCPETGPSMWSSCNPKASRSGPSPDDKISPNAIPRDGRGTFRHRLSPPSETPCRT